MQYSLVTWMLDSTCWASANVNTFTSSINPWTCKFFLMQRKEKNEKDQELKILKKEKNHAFMEYKLVLLFTQLSNSVGN